MLDLKDVIYFVQVVDRGGFTSASRSLRIPKSTLSHRVQQLEVSLGIRLVNRTSRRFRTTDVEREFYSHALTMWAVQPRTDDSRQSTKSRRPIDRRGQSAKRVRVCRRRRDARGALVAGFFKRLQRAGLSSFHLRHRRALNQGWGIGDEQEVRQTTQSGAQLVVRALEAQGITHIFGVPGGKIDAAFIADGIGRRVG